MDAKSQRDNILWHMQVYGSITPLEALEKYGCFRLGARIWELIHTHGHSEIESEMVRTATGKRVARYSIPQTKQTELRFQ